MDPVKFSLRYPTVTLILTAMAVAVGLYSFLYMPRTEDPTSHHSHRPGDCALSGRDFRTGRKAGNKNPGKTHFQISGNPQGENIFNQPPGSGHYKRGT